MSSPSNSATIKDLLHEVTDAVEPGDRLDAIRAATADSGRRTQRGWWGAGGVGLVAASVVTALALTTGGDPGGSEPGPADESTVVTDTPPAQTTTVPVYYVGETWNGPRLYREFRPLVAATPAEALTAAADAAVGGPNDGTALRPLDPDYRSRWPAGTRASARVVPGEDRIEVDLTSERGNDLTLLQWKTAYASALSIEALVRTVQGVAGSRLPVRILFEGRVTPQVLGVPTSEELATAPDLDVLAHVNISDPFEGQVVDNDESFVVNGVGTGYEGNIVTAIEQLDGTEVVDPVPAIASGEGSPRLWPYEATFDLTDVPPGVYKVTSRTEDPSGAGNVYEDGRTITVVD